MKNEFALFLGTQDGSTFKAQVKFAPYFYIGTKVNKSDLILSDLVVAAESLREVYDEQDLLAEWVGEELAVKKEEGVLQLLFFT